MLCADGKKVTAGVDGKGVDVDMFSFEDGVTYGERKQHLEEILKLNDINDFIQRKENTEYWILDAKVSQKSELCRRVWDILEIVGQRLKDCKELAIRQKMGLEKFKGMAGDNWRESKFVFVISGLQASLFQLKEIIENGLSCTNSILSITSDIINTGHYYATGNTVDLSYQGNVVSLKDDNETASTIEPRFLKQRSDVWHLFRRSAKVTGSTLHSAVGLRGLKEQKLHYEKFKDGLEVAVSEDVQMRMTHGSNHEKDAIATLVGRILPVYFPECFFVEEGCYIIPGGNVDIWGVVSPDGSIRLKGPFESENSIVAAIEIKCPWPNNKKVTLHNTLPDYYVCQVLAEMFVLKTETQSSRKRKIITGHSDRQFKTFHRTE